MSANIGVISFRSSGIETPTRTSPNGSPPIVKGYLASYTGCGPYRTLICFNDVAVVQLRKQRPLRHRRSRHLRIAGRQHHSGFVHNHHVVNPQIRSERRLHRLRQSVISLKRLPHVIPPSSGASDVACIPLCLRPPAPALPARTLVASTHSLDCWFLNHLAGQPGKIHAGKGHHDEEHQPRHHQREFGAQPVAASRTSTPLRRVQCRRIPSICCAAS